MNKAKRKMLEKKGWKVGTAEEFLGLSPAESRSIESETGWQVPFGICMMQYVDLASAQAVLT